MDGTGRCVSLKTVFTKTVLFLLTIPMYVVIFLYMRKNMGHEHIAPPVIHASPLSLHSSLAVPKFTDSNQNLLNETDRRELPPEKQVSTNLTQQTPEETSAPQLDIHLNDPELGHTGETIGHVHTFDARIHANTIAIGGGITSAKIKPDSSKKEMLSKMPMFNTLLPSFCATSGAMYSFHFYLAYDYTDKLFSNPKQLQTFAEVFHEQVKAKCSRGAVVELHMVQCDHTKKPAWAQNDAMMEAYIDNMEYFYRINDDSKLENSAWPDLFVQRLKQYQPANLGVVGPSHVGGNTAILTYDFTHHTHHDMFGFHYPRDFTDWYADDWVTGVYRPGRVEKMKSVPLRHTMQLGQRYQHHADGYKLGPRYVIDKAILQRYARYLETKDTFQRDPSKVLAISVFDVNPIKTVGALRNVQLAPVFFPEWTVRVYVPSSLGATKDSVPNRILNKMETLGAEIYSVDNLRYPEQAVAFHIIHDTSVRAVLFREPEFRVSERQKSAVDEWMASPSLMHCMRDHPSHADLPIVPGLLGIKLAKLRDNPQQYEKFTDIVNEEFSKPFSDGVLERRLWKEYEQVFMCHDSVSCDKWTNSKPFPVAASSEVPSYEGQRYDEHMVSLAPYKYNVTEHKCV